jgi:hypothetical protein
MSLAPAHAPYSIVPIQAHPDRLYVVTVIFNPRRFRSRYRLYRTFAKQMEDSGVQLLTVEIAFGDRPFEVTDAFNPWHLQLRTSMEMWHKERAINLGIRQLRKMVAQLKYVAWIDADVTFLNSDWAHETIQMLQHHPVIQLFGVAANLDPDGHVQWTCPSCFREFLFKGYLQGASKLAPEYSTSGHPGLAWAATNQALLELGDLIDTCIAGSGDSHIANCLKGSWNQGVGEDSSATLNLFSKGFQEAIRDWGERAERYAGNVGFVTGTVAHHWHGRSETRGYKNRMDILQKWKFDPSVDLLLDEASGGLYSFKGNKPGMEAEIKRTMILRNEDGVDVR